MKKSELQQLIKEEISKVSEGIFGHPFDKERANIQKAMNSWVKYSLDNGDSEADIFSVGEIFLERAIEAYKDGKK